MALRGLKHKSKLRDSNLASNIAQQLLQQHEVKYFADRASYDSKG